MTESFSKSVYVTAGYVCKGLLAHHRDESADNEGHKVHRVKGSNIGNANYVRSLCKQQRKNRTKADSKTSDEGESHYETN